MELTPNHVVLPREDFIELSTAAYDIHPTPFGERMGTTVQTTLVFAGMSAAFAAGCWAWAKAVDWREERQFQRETERRAQDSKAPHKE